MTRKQKTMDGNAAAAHVAYAFTEAAPIYPITPSSPIADYLDIWSTEGRENIFGHSVALAEMQSEAGAAGAMHGSLLAGALTSTCTASQGLLLMIPDMYKIAGELLPCVMHVTARAVATHALSIFGDHSDIYACRQTGFAMLCSSNVQEVMDLSVIAHLTAIKGRVPFLHFFDGFRTSHELQKIEVFDYEDLKAMLDTEALEAFRKNALNPEHPVLRGTAQNPDIFFQAREACNSYYDAVPKLTQAYMDMINKETGSSYRLFNYYGAADAEKLIVAMGSVTDTIEETIDYLLKKKEKVGLIKVRLYRPFSVKHFLEVLPSTVKCIYVLDRTKEPGAPGEPLYLDVAASLKNSKFAQIPVFNGRYGLGSKDTTPSDIIAVYNNQNKTPFTIGIIDDVTELSLKRTENPDTSPEKTTSCKFWGLGADGTVGANKNSIKIIGDHTSMYVQAYFDYDSKKSGGVTTSHLRFGEKPIKSSYFINKADFVACHMPAYIRKYNMVQELKDGGTFLLNCPWNQSELERYIPAQVKRYMAEHEIKFYTIDGIKIGREIGLGGRINTILQAAFFKLAGIIPVEEAVKYMKEAATATYLKKGEEIVKMNHTAIERGIKELHRVEIPAAWAALGEEELAVIVKAGEPSVIKYVNTIQNAVNMQNGNNLPVSAFLKHVDGSFPLGTAAYEKRGIAIEVPVWHPEVCIQCNLCSYVCPHSCIRPVVMTAEQAKKAPSGSQAVSMKQFPDMSFAVSVSVLDCTGCGSCVNVCPVVKNDKALSMAPLTEVLESQKLFDYGAGISAPSRVFEKFKETTPKGSQFKQPLLEFSGACAGCGETPYAKLVTQLFGDRMYIANATGCSSIWGASSPSSPYTVNSEGKGPAWANSLFEDNAEFGFGMQLGQSTLRNQVIEAVKALTNSDNKEVSEACEEFLSTRHSSTENAPASEKLLAALLRCDCLDENKNYILRNKRFLSKKSQWIFGGDGFAYDIGFGGLDHVLASGQDVNILIFDTEVYSNTGGQASKATPLGAIAQFAAAGKSIKKKDLAAMAMTYGYVYVAQISQGADFNQCVRAISEAESYNGPSLIIAYAPCINHGLKAGLSTAQAEEKHAVAAGYWHLFRFDPRLAENGHNPFQLDSKAPSEDFTKFLLSENRYSRLLRADRLRAERLFKRAAEEAAEKYDRLSVLAKGK